MGSTIRDFIRDDLTRRIGSNDGPPIALTLEALSRHYGVSLTPVREAVRDLVQAGILLKGATGRLEAQAVPEGLVATAGPQAGSPQDLESDLASEVIRRSLLGEIDYLREEATARRYRVGRTAIRQVFGRLAGRGLLVHVPRCGWLVRKFDEADLAHYLEVRETLELKALDLAREHLNEGDLGRMLAGNADERIDNDLHRYLVEKSGNPYLRDFFDRHAGYFTTLFDYATPEAHEVAAMALQHREILQSLIDRDWPGARRALVRHIRAQRSIVRDLLKRLGRPESPTQEPRP